MTIWSSDDILDATGGKSSAIFGARRVHIDSRTVMPGDLFVPLKGTHFDGHEFIAQAFTKGASAALVAVDSTAPVIAEQPLVAVEDTLKSLGDLAAYNRKRSKAAFIGVTGSVGKTSAKDMLALALSGAGEVYATQGNLNNHIGLPLMLANMPKTAAFGVFEIGMNHAGEIAPLAALLKPHVALITSVEAVHLEFFASLEAIADAKAEIMEGLSKDGTLILNRDSASYEQLAEHAKHKKIAHVISFGEHAQADCRLVSYAADDKGSRIEAELQGQKLFYRLGAVGRHWAVLSLGVLAACRAAKADLAKAAERLSEFSEGEGRGKRFALSLPGGAYTLIDDGYNASPASMNAAFARLHELAAVTPTRTLAVLGDMLELGATAPQLHAALAENIGQHGVDVVFACGPLMKHLYDALPAAKRGGYAADAAGLLPLVQKAIRSGDLVLIKGSHGSNMKRITSALKNDAL